MEVDGEEALEEHDQPSWCRGGWRDSEQCMAGGSWLKGPWVQKASGRGHAQRPCVCKTVGYSASWLEQAPQGGGCEGLAGLSHQRVTGNVQIALPEGHVHRLSTGLYSLQRLSKGIQGPTCHFFQ